LVWVLWYGAWLLVWSLGGYCLLRGQRVASGGGITIFGDETIHQLMGEREKD
jgi:hypothetical protein